MAGVLADRRALLAAAVVLRIRGGHTALDVSLQGQAQPGCLIALVIIWTVARAVLRKPGRITYHRVIGAILLYLTIGLVFVALLLAGRRGLAQRLHRPDGGRAGCPCRAIFIYFSFTTLTTVGYGDIVPVHPVARSLSNVEAIVGQLYPATLLARLVSLGERRAA